MITAEANFTELRKTTVSKMTSELVVGDWVLTHGLIFEIVTKNISKAHNPTQPGGVCYWHTTKLIHTFEDGKNSMPKHWKDEWTIQGNDYATWAVCQK